MSCRRGTPRNDCGCCKSLAEKVRELYQRCANAIKSINGINPDGANNFDILPGAGIQVNPRANGIEIVATGAAPQGMIETINSEGPDTDGNFAITAGSGIQINAGTNGFEIENTSQGAVYTGVSPVVINADNEISLEGWTEHPIRSNLDDVRSDGVTLKDILITGTSVYGTGSNHILTHCNIFIPKGTTLSTFYIGFDISAKFGSTDPYTAHFYCFGVNIISTDAVIYGRQFTTSTYTSGSGISETTNISVSQNASATISKDYFKLYVR